MCNMRTPNNLLSLSECEKRNGGRRKQRKNSDIFARHKQRVESEMSRMKRNNY